MVRILDEHLTDLAPPLAGYQLSVTRRWVRPSSYELTVPDTFDPDTLTALLPKHDAHGNVVREGGSTYLVIDGRPFLTEYPRWESDTRTWKLRGTCASMLDHRLVEHFTGGGGWFVTSGSAAERMRAVVVSQAVAPPVPEDRVPHLSAAPTGPVGPTGRTEGRYQTVAGILERVGQCNCVGWDVTFDGSGFVWAADPGRDLTGEVTIDLDLGTALTMVYAHDQRETATRVVLAGQGEGADRTIHTVGGGSGLHRRTMFRDARDIDDESADPTAVLESRGLEALAASDPGPQIQVEPNVTAGFGTVWTVGDVVTVSNRMLGLHVPARVVEAEQTVRSGLPEVRVAFDRPFPSLTDGDRSQPTFARS